MRKFTVQSLLVSFFFVLLMPFSLISAQDSTRVDSSLVKLDSATLAAIRFNPHDVQFHIKRGMDYLKRDFPDSATTAFKLALTICDTIPAIYNYLGIIELNKADHFLIPVQKLLRLLRQDQHSKAIKYFKKALALAPEFIDAHYNLGKAYLFRGRADDLVQAEKEFKFILERLFHYKDTIYLLGRTFQQRDEYDRAISIFKGLAEARQADGRESIRLAEIYYEINQYELACSSYFRGLEILNDEETFDEIYVTARLLFTDSEKAEFQALKLDQKGRFFRKLWLSRDPSPGTVLNERLIEHFRRVEFARRNYHYTAPPFYDDRGKIYIKFGAPSERFALPVDQTFAKPNESWCYTGIHQSLVFDFVEEGGVYRLVEDLRDAALPGTDAASRLKIAGELYAQRAHVSNIYGRLSMGIDQSKIQQFHSDRIRARAETPPEVFRPYQNAKTLPIVYKLSQFKGRQDSTEALVYFSLPAVAFNFRPDKQDERYASHLDYALVLLDSLYNPQYQFNLSKPLYLPSLDNVKYGNFVFQNHHQFLPGEYELQILVKTKAPRRVGLYKEKYTLNNFATEKLTMSDLLLAASIEPAAANESEFVRNDLKVIPHPFVSVLHKKPIYLYFEIYNLGYDENGEVRYEIAYTAKTIEPKQSVLEKAWGFLGGILGGSPDNAAVTTTHERKSRSRDVFEYLAFDFQAREGGRTRLTVEVTDLHLQQTIRDSVEFDLID